MCVCQSVSYALQLTDCLNGLSLISCQMMPVCSLIRPDSPLIVSSSQPPLAGGQAVGVSMRRLMVYEPSVTGGAQRTQPVSAPPSYLCLSPRHKATAPCPRSPVITQPQRPPAQVRGGRSTPKDHVCLSTAGPRHTALASLLLFSISCWDRKQHMLSVEWMPYLLREKGRGWGCGLDP